MKPAAQVCRKLGLSVDVRVLSAHRTPEQTAAYVRETAKAGTKVFICGAGGAAHLAGASGCPHHSPSHRRAHCVRQPAGHGRASVDCNDAPRNSSGDCGHWRRRERGLLAAQIIALGDPALAKAVTAEREARLQKVLEADAEVREKW